MKALETYLQEFNKQFRNAKSPMDSKRNIFYDVNNLDPDKFKAFLSQMYRELNADRIAILNTDVAEWMRGQGITIEDAFTAGDIEDILEQFTNSLKENK